MIKNIIFDVGQVLVKVRWLEVMQELGFDKDTIEKVADATVRSRTWSEYDRSLRSYEELLSEFVSNSPEVEEEIRLFMDHEKEAIQEFPYAKEWVKKFKDKGYHCYVLSNYPKRTFEITCSERSFEEHMDGTIYSYAVQKVKPEKEIYQTLLERYDLIPEECVFLDDNLANVDAARKIGIQALHFQTKEEIEEQLRQFGVEF